MEFSRQQYWTGLPFPSPEDLPDPGIEPRSPALQEDSLSSEPPEKPKNTGVGSLSLLQGIFPTQQLNQGLLHCTWIFYQLSYQGSPNLQYSQLFTSLWLINFWPHSWLLCLKPPAHGCHNEGDSFHSSICGNPCQLNPIGSDGSASTGVLSQFTWWSSNGEMAQFPKVSTLHGTW